MGQTLKVERDGLTPVKATKLVHSPDDGGYYLSQADFRAVKSRTSVKVWPTDTAARAEWNAGTVEWESWDK